MIPRRVNKDQTEKLTNHQLCKKKRVARKQIDAPDEQTRAKALVQKKILKKLAEKVRAVPTELANCKNSENSEISV